jgi:hypothetical protein
MATQKFSPEDTALLAKLRTNGLHAEADDLEEELVREASLIPSGRQMSALEYNTALAKLLQRLRQDAGAETIRQNYRGTGSRAYRRQLYVRFTNGSMIDLWLEDDRIELGGVVRRSASTDQADLPKFIRYASKSPAEIYAEVAHALRSWA